MADLFEEIGQSNSSVIKEKVEENTAKVKPSGSGLTFFMDTSIDEDDLDDEMEDYRMDDALNRPSTSEEIIQKTMDKDQESDLQKELTEKYISGQISFKDYIKQIDDDDEDEDIEEEDGEDESDLEGDEEWMPSGAEKKTRKRGAKSNESVMEEFSKDLKEATKQQLGRKKARLGVRTRKKLDPTLQGLIGEANLSFVRGDIETAIKLCFEVIRHDPRAPEPFQTLSTVYEESGEFEKSVQFALIGAHLAPPDAEEWERLANMSLELNDVMQAASCLKKAIDSDSSILKYHRTRCDLLESINEKKKALQGYRRLLSCLKPDQGADYMETAQEIARLLHERGDFEAAKNAIQAAMDKHPDHVQPQYVNLLLEELITLNEYAEALQVLCQRASAKFESDKKAKEVKEMSHQEQLKSFKKVTLPAETPMDIKVKLLVILLHLKAVHLVAPYAKELLDCQVAEFGDLMLDACEAYMGQKCWVEALKFAEKLVSDDFYDNAAAVWLQYGQCLLHNQRLDEAEKAYQKVVEMAPQHYEARRALSNILHKLGRPEEALLTLSQDEKAELLNPTLLYEKCQLLFKEGHTEEFVKKATLLFSRHFTDLRSREEVLTLCSSKKYSQKRLTELRSMRPEVDISEDAPSFEQETSIKITDEFALLKNLCDVLFAQKRYVELQRITFSALGCPGFNKDPEIIKEVEFLCLLSAFLNKDSFYAYNYVRELVGRDVKNAKLWNLFNLIVTNSDDTRHHKFLMRRANKNPDNVPIGILNGNNCLLAGTYKYSLGEYMNVYKVERNNPMVPLMLGVTFVHLACQKFSSRKHSLVVQGCAFLQNYAKMRGNCQETCYNLGRAMHQLGILPAAMHYYKKVLDMNSPVPEDEEDFSLKREAAFNLSLIYKNAGSEDLARMLIDRYIVI